MGRASRRKGKVGEREVVNAFLGAGIPCRRRWEEQSKPGGQQLGDLAIAEESGYPIYAEVRRRKTLGISSWVQEVRDKAPEGYERAVITRWDGEPEWQVILPLSQYIALLKKAGVAAK